MNAPEEPVVQVRLVALEDLLAVPEPARDDERRVDDRHRKHEVACRLRERIERASAAQRIKAPRHTGQGHECRSRRRRC